MDLAISLIPNLKCFAISFCTPSSFNSLNVFETLISFHLNTQIISNTTQKLFI